MVDPRPQQANGSSRPSASAPPTITTITIPGTVITSTTYTTITTTITSSIVTTITRTATATVSTVSVVTVTVEAPTPTTPLQASVKQEMTGLPQQLTQAVAQAVSGEVEELRVQLLSALARARAIADAWYSRYSERSLGLVQRYNSYINRINDLVQRVANAKTLDELNKLKQEVDALLRDVENLKVDATLVASKLADAYATFAQQVKDENLRKTLQQTADVYNYLAKNDLNTIRKDVALFYMLMDMTRDDAYQQVYESHRESFQALLRILSNNATYSDVEKSFEALAIIKQLKDQGMLDEKKVFDEYVNAFASSDARFSFLGDTVYGIKSLTGGASEVQQRFNEILSKVSSGEEPERRKTPSQVFAEAVAVIDPTRYIYNLAFNGVKAIAQALGADENTANNVADKVAAGVTGAVSGVVGVLAPPLGLAMALSATLDTVSDIASRLASPVDRELFLKYLQSNWQDLIVDTAIGVAAGLGAGYATAKLKPVIYNKIADALERLGAKDLANKIRLSVGVPVEGGKGALEATVREIPEEVSIESNYDPATGKATLKITLGGKTEVIDVNVPKELENKFKAYGIATEQASELPGGGTQINKALETAFKLIYKTVKDRDKALQMFKDFVKKLGLGDDVAIQTLVEATKSDVVGDVMLKIWSNSSTIYDNAKGLCRYVERGGKVWQIVGANDEASSIIRGIVINDDEASMRMLVSNQAYLYPKTGEGNFLNAVLIEKYMPQDAYLALLEDLKKLFNAIKANIEVLKQVREHPEGGGLPPDQIARALGIELKPETQSILRSDPVLRNYIETALMSMLRGVDVYPIIVYDPSTSFMRASILIPATVASTALQSIVERGVAPSNLRVVPIHRQVIETVVATRIVEDAVRITSTIFTGIARSVQLKENAVHRTVAEPAQVVKALETEVTQTIVQPTALTRQVQLKEVPIHRTDVVPEVVTSVAEAVATAVLTHPTAITRTQQLIEKPVHRVETVPVVVTQIAEDTATSVATLPTSIVETRSLTEKPVYRTETVPEVVTKAVEVVVPQVVTHPTALTKQVTLSETAIHRTSTEPYLVTSSTTVVVVTTSTVTGKVIGTGTVSVVTIPVVITYTYTVPITIAGVTPAPATPPTPTETGTGTGTVTATPPLLPKLPSLEGAGATPAGVKPEQKPRLEREILVI